MFEWIRFIIVFFFNFTFDNNNNDEDKKNFFKTWYLQVAILIESYVKDFCFLMYFNCVSLLICLFFFKGYFVLKIYFN